VSAALLADPGLVAFLLFILFCFSRIFPEPPDGSGPGGEPGKRPANIGKNMPNFLPFVGITMPEVHRPGGS
jgi:hypothetical protein